MEPVTAASAPAMRETAPAISDGDASGVKDAIGDEHHEQPKMAVKR